MMFHPQFFLWEGKRKSTNTKEFEQKLLNNFLHFFNVSIIPSSGIPFPLKFSRCLIKCLFYFPKRNAHDACLFVVRVVFATKKAGF